MSAAPRERLDGMDALRAWAAVGVVVVHVYSLNRIVTPPAIAEVVNKFGLGVELFFALSAFCLAVGYFGKLSTEETIRRWSPFIWSCLAVTAITIFLADVAYRLIEKPGVALGKRLLSRTASLPAPSPSPQTQAL